MPIGLKLYLSKFFFTCFFEIVDIEGQLNNLCIKASKLGLKEQETIKEEVEISAT